MLRYKQQHREYNTSSSTTTLLPNFDKQIIDYGKLKENINIVRKKCV